MCNLETEGTKYGCGHYVSTRVLNKIDCRSRFCRLSSFHPPSCTANECAQFYGPDRTETIVLRTPNYCNHCQYWYRGDGSRPR